LIGIAFFATAGQAPGKPSKQQDRELSRLPPLQPRSRSAWRRHPRGRALAAGLLLASACAAAAPVHAQGKLDAHYEVTLAGIPVGRGTWTIEIADDHYAASAAGGTTGLLKAISGGRGSGSAQGRIVNGQLVPANYTAMTETSKKVETIRIALAGGNITGSTITPEPPEDPARIPVTDAQRRGVLDPMTGTLLQVPGTADPVSAEACKASAAVFDGRMRYELRLAFKRLDKVKAAKGYQGPAVVCAIYFTPVSGYVPDRAAIKYLSGQRNMEVWLAPIAGTRVLVPFKVMIPTPLGTGMMLATDFVTTASPPRAAARTQ
jgi:hypothetical protein